MSDGHHLSLHEAAQQALNVLESATSFLSKKARDNHGKTVADLRAALAQQDEPVAQPLTDDQIHALFPMPHKDAMTRRMEQNIARAVERAHKIGDAT